MEDYPVNLTDFEARFSTEEGCRDYLIQLRWPDGFRCPRCDGTKAWPQRLVLLHCASCNYQASVLAGTVFQDTHKPLTLWFRAMWYVTSQKNGASALGLQRVLGLRSYQTAWAWLHKLRRAMVRPGRERLKGWVEVDEAYLGGEEEGVTGRQFEDKALIVVAAEADGKGIGRIRLRHIPDASAASLHPFVVDSIEPGSTVHTDGWKGYQGLDQKGFDLSFNQLAALSRSSFRTSSALPSEDASSRTARSFSSAGKASARRMPLHKLALCRPRRKSTGSSLSRFTIRRRPSSPAALIRAVHFRVT
jgi:transposase-like protein